jgi:hypothetical protein
MKALKKIFGFVFVVLLIAGCGSGGDESPQVVENIQLGNPPELALTPEEYLPGDQLFEPGDADYYREGTPYVTVEIERELRALSNHPAIDILREKFNDDRFHFPEEYLGNNALDQAMYLDDEGRKQLDGGFRWNVQERYLWRIYGISDSPIPEAERPINQRLGTGDIATVDDFSARLGKVFKEYRNENRARYEAVGVTLEEELAFEEAETKGGE